MVTTKKAKKTKHPRTKIQLKVALRLGGNPRWKHFCYVDEKLFKTYLEHYKLERSEFSQVIERWVLEEFNVIVQFQTDWEVDKVRELIFDRYTKVYPYVAINRVIDHKGWVGIWVTEQMGRELKKHARPKFNKLFKSTKNFSD